MHIGNFSTDEFIQNLMKVAPRIPITFMGKEAILDINKETLGKVITKVIEKMIQYQNKQSHLTPSQHSLILGCQPNQILTINNNYLLNPTN